MSDFVQQKASSLTVQQEKDLFQFVFASESGQLVLELIKRAGFFYKDAVTESVNTVSGNIDTSRVLFINGQQALVKYILSMMERDTSNPVPGMEPGAVTPGNPKE